MALTDLPLELIEQIVSNICHGTFADFERARYYSTLRLVSRHMNQLLLPTVFSQITLDFHVCHRISYESQIAAILSPNSPAAQFARTLRIMCLSPLEGRDERDRRGNFLGEDWEKINKATRKAATALSVMVEKNLGAILSALQNVQNIEYHVYPNDPVRGIVERIRRMPRLNNLTIILKGKVSPEVPGHFSIISGLHSLTLQSNARIRDITPASFSRLICQNPDLNSLTIKGFAPDTGLDALVQQIPASSNRVLRIANFQTDCVGLTALNVNTPRHFDALTSLDLTHLKPEFDSPAFWQGLSTQVTKLGIHTLTNHHVDYLLSYQGLKELRIEELEKDMKPSRIFTEILTLHQHTLTKLELGTFAPNSVFVTAENIEQLHLCHQLQSLSLVYNANDVIIKDNNIPLLKNTFELAEAVPRLNNISLGCCYPSEDERSADLAYRIMLMQGATNVLFSAIKKCRFSNNKFPGLVINIPQSSLLCRFGRVDNCYGFVPVGEEHPPDYIMHPSQFWTAYDVRKASNVSFMKKTKRLFVKKRK